jgi:cytochrome d ubiquinol oxidase subunit II
VFVSLEFLGWEVKSMFEHLLQIDWLPYAFAILMGLSLLIYAVLDGFDLGIGILGAFRNQGDRDDMISAIGPFWDANETWLVLAVGLLLVAFPKAHGVILGHLYLPILVMLIGLILRGVAFDFRAKTPQNQKLRWDRIFIIGSSLVSLSQGYMLGQYVVGFEQSSGPTVFSVLVAFALSVGYMLIGSCWLIIKSTNELQIFAISTARKLIVIFAALILFVSIAKPIVKPDVLERVDDVSHLLAIAPVPLLTFGLAALIFFVLRAMPLANDALNWLPFVVTIGIFLALSHGLVFNLFPYVIPNSLTLIDAASSRDSLLIIFVGTLVVMPFLVGYSIFLYRVFRGKAVPLSYE